MQGVDYYIDEIKHKGTDKQYIAHASTWLNQQRWDDEYTGPKYVNKNKKINNKPFIPLVMDYDKHTPTDQHDEVHGTTNT